MVVPAKFSLRYNRGMPTADNLIEDVTEDGFRVVRENRFDLLLNSYYMIFNQQLFNGSLPQVPVFWAKRITQPNGHGATAVYVPGDAKLKRRYIAIDDTLSGMFPLERLCLLHEMVHVKVGPDCGHGEEFVAEFRRVLDANKWEVMGCIDGPPPDAQNTQQTPETETTAVNPRVE